MYSVSGIWFLKILELSITAIFFTSVSSSVAIQAGAITIAAKRRGPKMVITMKLFFLTRVRYSRCKISFILLMMNIALILVLGFVFNYSNKYIIHPWNEFFE